jgi:hypothetical protein
MGERKEKDMNTVERAKVLAATRGIKTSAKTLRGLMAALRGSKTVSRPGWRSSGKYSYYDDTQRATANTVVAVADLIKPFNQGRARTRLIDEHEPLRAAVSAALGDDVIGWIEAMPNSYRAQAEASACSAVRHGDAIHIVWGRFTCPHRPHGHGGKDIIPSRDKIVRRRELMQAIRLPHGYRWATDRYGPHITGSDITDYHPTGREMADAIASKSWDAVIAKGRAFTEKRRLAKIEQRNKTKIDRAARLLARIGHNLQVSRADAKSQGYCDAGIAAWCNRAGITPDVKSMSAKQLMELASKTNEPRVAVAVLAAARRVTLSRMPV